MHVLAKSGGAARGRHPLVLALLTLVALVATVLVPVQAQAETNTDIAVTNLTLVKSTTDGIDSPGESLTRWNVVRLTYTWDASNANVKAGDSFTVGLGDYLRNLEFPRTADMTVTYNGEQVTIGSCQLSRTEITCTFSDEVERLKAAGFTSFRGTGDALLMAHTATTSDTVDMTVNGTVTAVDLPGDGGIADVGNTYEPFTVSKTGADINSQTTRAVWEINFGADFIQSELAKGGTELPLDGETVSTITITDTLGSGMAFDTDMSTWIFRLRNSAAEPTISGVDLTNAAGEDYTDQYGDFDLEVTIEGQVAKVSMTGPFAADTNYKLLYPVTFTSQSGTPTLGVQYINNFRVDGTQRGSGATRSIVDTFKVSVEMAAGFGGFEVLKTLSGTGVDAVDTAATTLEVTVDYTLPGPASSYDGWEAPGTLNDDGVSGTTTMSVSIGRTNTYPATFPQGTVITLSEDTSSASPQPQGYTWGTPTFRVGNQQTATLTVADQTSTQVTLSNIAEAAPTPGTFQVRKEVAGLEDEQAGAQRDFTFSYTCSDGQSGSVTAKGDGQAVEAGQTFAPGTTCEVTEDVEAAQVEGYALVAPEPQTVTIAEPSEEEPAVTASFTNTYARETGSFSVVKVVEGGPAGTDQASFSVTYTCDEGTQGTLSVPGDGTEVESPQLPAGATCTLEEDADSAAREGYSVATSLSPESVTITKGQVVAVVATNTYTRETGSFSVVKAVEGDYSPTSSDQVKVSYTCDDADSTSGTLEVPMDGSAVGGPTLPTGTTCTLEEDADSAAREGYAVATAYSDTTVSVVQGSTPSVTVTNSYTRLKGGFTISKTVDGDGASLADDKEFTFTYTCTDEVTGQAGQPADVTVKAGETVEISDVATGSCTVSEKDASVEGASLATRLSVSGQDVDSGKAVFEVAGGESSTVTVSATNTYTLERGTFSVSKKVEGDGADTLSRRSFVLDYTCSSQAEGEVSGELTVAGDGSVTESGLQLPVGAQCEVSERTGSAQAEGYTLTAPEMQTLTIVATGEGQEPVTLSFTNTYAEVPPSPGPSPDPSPSPSPGGTEPPAPGPSPSGPESAQPGGSGTPTPTEVPLSRGPSLARTGASVLVPLAVALAAVAAGAVLLRRRRRH